MCLLKSMSSRLACHSLRPQDHGEFATWSPGQRKPTQEDLPESPVDVLQGMQTAGHTEASLPGTLEKSLWLKWQEVFWEIVPFPVTGLSDRRLLVG